MRVLFRRFAFTVLFVGATTIGLVVMLEVGCDLYIRVFHLPDENYQRGVDFHSDRRRAASSPYRIATSIRSRQLADAPLRQPIGQPLEHVALVGGISGRGTKDGLAANPVGRNRVQELDGKSVVYDVEYLFDAHQRREIRGRELEGRPFHFLTLGCSQTLGEGVPEGETFAAQFAKLETEFKPYILAQNAANPAQLLAMIRKFGGLDGISQRRGIAVLRIFDYHFQRLVRSLSVGHDLNWRAEARRGADGRIDVSTTFEESRPFYVWLLKWVWQTGIRRMFRVDFPLWYGDEDLRLMADVIKEIKDAYSAKTSPDNPFIVVLGPRHPDDFWSPFDAYLEERGIHYVDYGGVEETKLSDKNIYIHPSDFHYRGEFNKTLAGIFDDDLSPILDSFKSRP